MLITPRIKHIASTSNTHVHFFGFHDISPWDQSNQRLLVHIVDHQQPLRVPNGQDYIQVGLWDPNIQSIDTIGETNAWNWQQGARLQWLPTSKNTAIFNITVNGYLKASLVDFDTSITNILDFPCYVMHPKEKLYLSINFGRLHQFWPAYGAPGKLTGSEDINVPDDDGLFLVDLNSNTVRWKIGISDLVQLGHQVFKDNLPHFVSHPTFSPGGTRICFLHRFFTTDGSLYSRLVVCDLEGKNKKIIAEEKVSHFDWLNEDEIIVWTRFLPESVASARRTGLMSLKPLRPLINFARKMAPEVKQKLWKEAYYKINVVNGKREIIGDKTLEQDGHPMISRDGKWILTDTYADPLSRIRKLILYNILTGERIDLAGLDSPIQFGDLDMKCDLHPRWDRENRLVCVDSTHTGLRQMHIFDISGILDE